MVGTAYYLFSHHHIMPSQYNDMGYGEKCVTNAFAAYEIEQRLREEEEMRDVESS